MLTKTSAIESVENNPAKVFPSKTNALSIRFWELLCLPTLIIGTMFYAYAQSTWDVCIPITIHFIIGLIIVIICFPHKRLELRYYFITYSVYILMGGFWQAYLVSKGEDPANIFVDAVLFFERILDSPPYYTWNEMFLLRHPDGSRLGTNAPLAVWIWQRVYTFHQTLGCTFGSHIATSFNSMLAALTASITVSTARHLFLNNLKKANQVGLLYSLSGMIWLFGCSHMRDVFALFFNVIFLYSVVKILNQKKLSTFIKGATLIVLSTIGIHFIREKSEVIFCVLFMTSCLCWYMQGQISPVKLLVTIAIPIFLIVAAPLILQSYQVAIQYSTDTRENFALIPDRLGKSTSIWTGIILKLPLPAKLLISPIILFINPIPLWGFFAQDGVMAYYYFLNMNGLLVVLLIPLAIVGLILAIRISMDKEHRGIVNRSNALFFSIYVPFTVCAYAATSLDIRHYGQFLPGLFLISAFPDWHISEDKKKIKFWSYLWFGLVITAHLAYLIVRNFK